MIDFESDRRKILKPEASRSASLFEPLCYNPRGRRSRRGYRPRPFIRSKLTLLDPIY